MPTGSGPRNGPPGPRRPPGRAGQGGYTFVALLAVLALLGAALATLGTAWATAAQREKERELLFRGEQIRDAIGRYRAAEEPPAWPPSLAALLEDQRGPQVRHHLRRVWADPFTGRADWVLLEAADGGGARLERRIAGVRSRSEARRMALAGAEPVLPDDPRVSDWVFVFAAAPAPAAAASAAASPGS
jgi:type II secretory pathway pseudopilin PulG